MTGEGASTATVTTTSTVLASGSSQLESSQTGTATFHSSTLPARTTTPSTVIDTPNSTAHSTSSSPDYLTSSTSSQKTPASSTASQNHPASSSQVASHSRGLDAGAIVGIILGIFAGVLFIAWATISLRRRARERPTRSTMDRSPWFPKSWSCGGARASSRSRRLSSTWSWFGSVPIDPEYDRELKTPSVDLELNKRAPGDREAEVNMSSLDLGDPRPIKTQLAAWDPLPPVDSRLALPHPSVQNATPRPSAPPELLALADAVYAVSVLIVGSMKPRTRTSISASSPGDAVDRSVLGAGGGAAPSEKGDVDAV
ncbi:hypothetical protein BD310DRAFT_648904 [Dichomitus squalens]|uniref:Uncharacterized protein n=1 Tax=Dichomitus squalens TaxID=114155 RepID=A0A4V2K7F6_9APHY|nr:hypothetical protein BD310DRAFT_648904 [Dichomitus squalens]